ncbi:MAG: glycosyltransferase family 2 protein [Thermodesulfobacteriota bacterium]
MAQEAHPARIAVVIPALNEEQRVGAVVAAVRRALPRAPVLVVNDGSSDRTGEEARRAGAMVAAHPFRMGYGAALVTGYRLALRKGADVVLQLDGDGQHDAAQAPLLLGPVLEGSADIAIGSRFLSRNGYRPPLMRRAGIRLFSFLASLAGVRVTDPTSGFRALSRRAFSMFAESPHFPSDFPDADVIVLSHRAGLAVCEVPAAMRPCPGKISMHGGLAPVYYVFKMMLSMALASRA